MERDGELKDGKSRLVFASLGEAAEDIDPKRTVIVTDPEIRRLHGSLFPPCPIIEVERGEKAKTLASLEGLYGRFLELGLDRGSSVLAIGGGTVSDLSGFAASTWMRGLDFGFVPTTLLAMVDASIGGKNGVDFHGFKNLIGTFNCPRFVRFDVGLLSTLPDRDFSSGMGEVIKHAILASDGYFEFLETKCPNRAAINRAADGSERLEELVRRSVALKASVVALDEREAGVRRKLNLGHTIGHSIEALTGIPHGYAVAAGLAAALRLSVKRYALPEETCDRALALLASWGLPSSIREALSLAAELGSGPREDSDQTRALIADGLAVDKKRIGDEILFAAPCDIGQVRIIPIPVSELAAFVKETP
jgi:3-dehydroquinate synthase